MLIDQSGHDVLHCVVHFISALWFSDSTTRQAHWKTGVRSYTPNPIKHNLNLKISWHPPHAADPRIMTDMRSVVPYEEPSQENPKTILRGPKIESETTQKRFQEDPQRIPRRSQNDPRSIFLVDLFRGSPLHDLPGGTKRGMAAPGRPKRQLFIDLLPIWGAYTPKQVRSTWHQVPSSCMHGCWCGTHRCSCPGMLAGALACS